MATTIINGATGTETFGTSSAVTGTPPTTSASDGLPIQDLMSVTLAIACPSGQTLSGGGTMDCYIFDPLVANWMRYQTGDYTSIPSGANYQAFSPLTVTTPRKGSRIKWVPTSVTFSGGSTGLVTYLLGAQNALSRRYP